ncbi:hypothetical protein SLS62_006792 [Diatrype stigma]|uniref:FAD-binding domain-containing protein n=1 Tax=Diatrype stigma TaxID=117547 RepID=A0AAN9YQW2_9PEZI
MSGNGNGESRRPRIRVAIAGGGIAGLALAVGLAKKQPHAIEVRVYEAAAAYRDVGAGMALHRNAIGAMGLVGPELARAYFGAALDMGEDAGTVMATEVFLAQGPHRGQRVAELGRAAGRKTVSRADLLAAFLALVPPECVCFGKRLVGVEERPVHIDDDDDDGAGKEGKEEEAAVRLRFQDGSHAEADCLLGADGIHSFVRRHLLGADHPATSPKNHDGWQIYRVMVSAEEARRHINPKWTQHVPILLGARGHVNCIPLNKGTRLSAGVAVRRGSGGGGGGAGAAAAAIITTSRSPRDLDDNDGKNSSESRRGDRQPLPLDPALYADYTEEAQQIIRLVARGDTSASWALSDHDHAPCYARRGSAVAILGDAAHAALPFAGNGAAQALEDAAVLDCLFGAVVGADDDGGHRRRRKAMMIEDVLLAYDHVRRPRSQAVVDIARKFGRIYAYAEDGSK